MKKMKKTITLALATICFAAISFDANAQKKKYSNDGTMSSTIAKPYIGNAAILKAMDNVKTPYQNKSLAQFKGTININADVPVIFENNDFDKTTFYTYMIYLHTIKAGEEKGGIKLVEYDFLLPLTSAWYKNVVVTKVNDRQYNYTVYNVPLNTGVVVGLHYLDPCKSCSTYGPLSNMTVTNAFNEDRIYNGRGAVNAMPNYQATIAGQVLTLPTITISNPSNQVVN
jgi:hypothetical protein